MEVPVSISVKPTRAQLADVKFETISLQEVYENYPDVTVCRTCNHFSNRSWKNDKDQSFAALLNPDSEDVEDCNPTQSDIQYRVVQSTKRDKFVAIDEPSPYPTVAFVESCGHSIAPKCNGCSRFVREQVAIPYSSKPVRWKIDTTTSPAKRIPYAQDGAPINWWNATIGGRCSIPADGIVKNGKVTYCDPVRRRPNIEPSCSNCAFVDYVGESWTFEHLSVNENSRLTPYEYFTTYENALKAGEDPVAATNIRLWAKQTRGQGLIKTMKAHIIACYSRVDTQETRYLVNYDKTTIEDVISTLDPSIEILQSDVDKNYLTVQVSDTRLRGLGYNQPLKKYALIWPAFPARLEKKKPQDGSLDPRINHLCAQKKSLSSCSISKNKPCYFHAKSPVTDVTTGEVTFETPDKTNKDREIYPDHAYLYLDVDGDNVYVTDGLGNMPVAYSETVANAAVFRTWLPTLIARAKRISPSAPAQVMEQYRKVVNQLQRSTLPIKTRPYWHRDSTTEPAKARCTHPLGLDLRKVFGDTFGLERVDFDFDLGSKNTIEVEEEVRVGFRQHEHTPQQLHEEIMTNMMLDPRYVHSVGGFIEDESFIDDESFTTTQVPLIGGFESTQEMVDSLDDHINFGGVNDEDGNVSVPRFIDKRQQLFGYAMVNKAYGKRKGSDVTQLLNKDPDYVVFDHNFDVSQESVVWVCHGCSKTYGFLEVDLFDPRCDDCDSSLYRNHNVREVPNSRASGGVGNAYIKASDSTISNLQLGRTFCSNWHFKQVGSGINFETIYGQEGIIASIVQNEENSLLDNESVEVIKVNTLTKEQVIHNRNYDTLMDAVITKREEHLRRYPETKISELKRLYPTPKGKIYQEKIAGSLSKMGH